MKPYSFNNKNVPEVIIPMAKPPRMSKGPKPPIKALLSALLNPRGRIKNGNSPAIL